MIGDDFPTHFLPHHCPPSRFGVYPRYGCKCLGQWKVSTAMWHITILNQRTFMPIPFGCIYGMYIWIYTYMLYYVYDIYVCSYSPSNEHSHWKMVVGRRFSFWERLFSGSMLVLGRVHYITLSNGVTIFSLAGGTNQTQGSRKSTSSERNGYLKLPTSWEVLPTECFVSPSQTISRGERDQRKTENCEM